MRRSNKPCKGSELPNLPTVQCKRCNQLDCYCQKVMVGDVVLLHDWIHNDQEYYWVILEADSLPVFVCEFEAYVDKIDDWNSRRSDYLLIGTHSDHCVIIFVELRQNLIKQTHSQDKLDQLEATIRTFLSHTQTRVAVNEILSTYECTEETTKLVGIVLAPRGTRQEALRNRHRKLEMDGLPVHMVIVPNNDLSQCGISWTKIMSRVGIAVAQQRNTQIPHRFQPLW